MDKDKERLEGADERLAAVDNGEENSPTACACASDEDGGEECATVDPSEMSEQELAELRKLANEAQENRDSFLRARADLENYRKRAARERQEAVQFANQALVEKLLPALDTFEMALSATQEKDSPDLESLRTGLEMVLGQFRGALVDCGLEEIDAQDNQFDPNLHEAVSQMESAEVPEGKVIQQIRKGYRLRDRLIRPATVVVAKSPSE